MIARTATQATRSKAGASLLDVELQNVYKFFGREAAVDGIDLNIRQGEFFSILGTSVMLCSTT